MKRLLLTICLLSVIWSSALSVGTDVIVTTNGDVTAGLSRVHLRASAVPITDGVRHWVIVGEDSLSSTSHTLFAYYSDDEGYTWTKTSKIGAVGGFASTELDPAFSYWHGDTSFCIAPIPYSGTNTKFSMMSGTTVTLTDTLTKSSTEMITGLMRGNGDTAFAVYNDPVEGWVMVKGNKPYGITSTWTQIDTNAFSLANTNVDYDYCGSGVAVYDIDGGNLFWVDNTPNDAMFSIGAAIPALLSTTTKNAATMAVYHDSMIVVVAYLARDTSLWEYRWWATGGSRKTGLTLIDSTKLLPKNYFSGSAVDSMSPMPCLSGTIDGDTATLHVRMWMNPANADSIVIARSTTMYGLAAFDSTYLTRNNTTYGEGRGFKNLCAPRYINQNAIVFWQKGISALDSIYCSYDNRETYVIDGLTQIKSDNFSSAYTFQDDGSTNQIEDFWVKGNSTAFNYGASLVCSTNTGSGTGNAMFIRPMIKSKILYPCHIVWCSLEVKNSVITPATSGFFNVQRVWKPPLEGAQTGADPGANPGATFTAWSAANDTAANNWSTAGGGGTSGTADYNRSTSGQDRGGTNMNATSWQTPSTEWNASPANTVHGKALINNFDHWQWYLQGRADDSGWVRLVYNSANTHTFYSSETSTKTNGPKFFFNAYYTEPGKRMSTWQKNYRRRYISPGLRYKKL